MSQSRENTEALFLCQKAEKALHADAEKEALTSDNAASNMNGAMAANTTEVRRRGKFRLNEGKSRARATLIRFSDEQFEAIERKAAAAGLTFAEYVRTRMDRD